MRFERGRCDGYICIFIIILEETMIDARRVVGVDDILYVYEYSLVCQQVEPFRYKI